MLVPIVIYVVAESPEDAPSSLLFDSIDSADAYQQDNPHMEIYMVNATIDFGTLRPSDL